MKPFFEKITKDNGNEETNNTSDTAACGPNWCHPDHFCDPCDKHSHTESNEKLIIEDNCDPVADCGPQSTCWPDYCPP